MTPILSPVRRPRSRRPGQHAVHAHRYGGEHEEQRRDEEAVQRDLRVPERVGIRERRFGGRVEAVRAVFTGWCRDLAPDPVLPEPAGSAWADAIAAILAASAAVGARFLLGEVPAWQAAAAVSGARLLSPGWPVPTDQS